MLASLVSSAAQRCRRIHLYDTRTRAHGTVGFVGAIGGEFSPVWTGTVAGLASAILMALLMITYHMYPEPRRA